MATIELRDLEIYAHHGCYAEEQAVGTRFVIDADLEIDASRPSESDNVADALNYVEACELIAEIMSQPRHLLETVTQDIVSQLRQRFASKGLRGGWVRVRKIAPPIGLQMGSVGVKMEISAPPRR